MTATHLINGIQGDSLPLTDRACQYGDGVFETIAVYQSKALCLEEHLQRLLKGCERLGIRFQDLTLLKQEIKTSIANIDKAVLKIQISRGQGGRGYQAAADMQATRIVSVLPFPDFPKDNITQGITTRLAQTRYGHNAMLAGIKHMNRLEQVLAGNESYNASIAESIMLDINDNVIEGTRSNLFLCKDEQLFTPDLGQCGIEGIVRSKILNFKKETIIKQISLNELKQADEVFMCNSLFGVWSVNKFDDIGYADNKTARALRQMLIEQECIIPC